jgi:hypothetical protein
MTLGDQNRRWSIETIDVEHIADTLVAGPGC